MRAAWKQLVVLALVASSPASALAQKVIRMEEITIEGEIQKPQASYILQRSGKVDLGVDVRSFRPTMSNRFQNVLDEDPDRFRTDKK